MGLWDGHVVNKSKKTIWALVDDHEGDVYAKKVPPDHKSPDNVDVDAVKPVDVNVTIDGHNSWWRLGRGNSATVNDKSDKPNDLKIEGKFYGSLTKTKEEDWGRPGGNIKYIEDATWAKKI